MKLYCLLLLALLPLLSHSYPAAEEKAISLDEEVDNEHAETAGDSQIQKRSGSGAGSFDYVNHLKSGLLSSIGHASASIASGSSGSSSGGGGGGGYKSIDGHHGNSLDYDPWSFKKSVLNTIFQAVKAITGGVTALKGQLIKGSGYALSASGGLVASSGDKVTDVGKAIINSAQINSHGYGGGHSGGGGGSFVHPFAKLSSLSGASSSGSSGGGKPSSGGGPVLHTETITSYEIPAGHSSYGPPSKPPTFSTATHQYLPPVGGSSYTGSGGAPFSGGGHVAFEAPANNYLPSNYGHDGHDDFNIYGRHKKLSDEEARKAAAQLQEILSLLPTGKSEYTASKTVTYDNSPTGPTGPTGLSHQVNPEYVELQTYGLPKELGALESFSHTESITAAYGPRPEQKFEESPSDIYRQMAKKQSPEEVYIQKHPNEGYDYTPPSKPVESSDYRYNNYHAGGGDGNTNGPLKDLTPILAALEVAKRRGPTHPTAQTKYVIEKHAHKILPPALQNIQVTTGSGKVKLVPPVVQKSKYTYFDPAQKKIGSGSGSSNYLPPTYTATDAFKVYSSPPINRQKRRSTVYRMPDYEINNPLLFNQIMLLR